MGLRELVLAASLGLAGLGGVVQAQEAQELSDKSAQTLDEKFQSVYDKLNPDKLHEYNALTQFDKTVYEGKEIAEKVREVSLDSISLEKRRKISYFFNELGYAQMKTSKTEEETKTALSSLEYSVKADETNASAYLNIASIYLKKLNQDPLSKERARDALSKFLLYENDQDSANFKGAIRWLEKNGFGAYVPESALSQK